MVRVRALILGRFQPFHKGHLHVAVEVATWADEVIFGVAAATDSHETDNPFTAAERAQMIARAMKDARVESFRVVPIPDIHDHPIWARYVVGMCPPFDVVVAHNPVTLELFRKEGREVRQVPLFERERYSGTHVREVMASGGDWESLVPPAVAAYIRSIDGDDRVRRMAGSEQRPI